MAVHYHKYENQTLTDKRLAGTTRTLYDFMLAQSHLHGNDFIMSIAELAEGILRSAETTRVHLNKLIFMGFVTRILRRDFARRRWNLKSRFIVHPIAQETLIQEQQTLVEYATQGGYSKKTGVRPQKNSGGKEERENIRESKNRTLKGEAQELPSDYGFSEKSQPAPKYNLEGVPDILRPTAEYLLFKTGRTSLTEHEVEVLRTILAEQHYPTRINREIDRCVERFIRNGKNLKRLTFNYIGAILRNQRSLTPKKKSPEGKNEAQQATLDIPQEAIMPAEEAVKVIEEYTPAKKEAETLPAALLELQAKIKAKSDEQAQQYLDSLPVDKNGCYVFPETEELEDFGKLSMQDYLNLKYPEATEEELRTDYRGKVHEDYSDFPNHRELEKALDIDYTCALCESPEQCPLHKGSSRPIARLSRKPSGRRFLELSYGGCIMCKHGTGKKDNPDLERRIERSGLSPSQAKHTFENYKHEGELPEIVSAKAHAILAAKHRTNLILAGKAGTGKTHLATAIAIDVMRGGQQALFRTVPELLDEICRAHQEHTDPYGLMSKFKTVSCLVLDDWGKEKTTQARLDYLYQIIDYRYRHGLQTIVTTNAQNIAGLINEWNEDTVMPLVSRLLEQGKWVSVKETANRRLSPKVSP